MYFNWAYHKFIAKKVKIIQDRADKANIKGGASLKINWMDVPIHLKFP